METSNGHGQQDAVTLTVLGDVGVTRGGDGQLLRGAKQRTVLAALVLARGGEVGFPRFARLLWDDHPPATATAQVHTYISRLRRALGPVGLHTRGGAYVLEPPAGCSDLATFEDRAAQGRRFLDDGRAGRALDAYDEALSVWDGDALGGTTPYLIDAERPLLHECWFEAAEGRAEAMTSLGRHRQVLPELRDLVRAAPLRERLRGLLMVALYRMGRQAEALEIYYEGRAALADTLGVNPTATLEGVFRAILDGDDALYPATGLLQELNGRAALS